MTTEELLIHQLAQRAGITVRTIRYYIEEGLLPPPTYQGKYSFYSLKYLDRLELIRRLKETYLPLREIREIMNSLTDEQVKLRLKELPRTNLKFSMEQAPSRPVPKPGAQALEYIDRLMEDQTRYKTKGSNQLSQPNIRKDRDEFLPRDQSLPFQAADTGEQTWMHILLAPGVELHIRQPLDKDTDNRVHQLINDAQRIFQEKP